MSVARELSLDRLPGPGTVLGGRFRIERTLGAGGMGAVFEVEELATPGRRIAIKVMLPQLAEDPEFVARFSREARSVTRLTSEHAVRVLETGTFPDGAPFMAMELLEGENFDQLLRAHGPMPVREAAGWLLQACDAIADAHANGIVHRDIKPSNLFLAKNPDGTRVVKVLDFGISKAIDLAEGATDISTLTHTGSQLGSPQYMSPEQFRNSRKVDLRTDIWAFGMVLHRMLTGRFAFEADSLGAHIMMIVVDPPTPLRIRRPDAPPEIEGAILRCLQKDPLRRYSSVAGFASAIAKFGPPGSDALLAKIVARLGSEVGSLDDQPLDDAEATRLQRPGAPFVGYDSSSIPGQTGSRGQSPEANTNSGWAPNPASIKAERRTSRALIAALIVTACGSVAGIVALVAATRADPAAAVASTSASTATPAVTAANTAAPSGPAAATAAAPKDVEVRLRVEPAGASVELDGVRVVDNPLRVPRGGGPHKLRVSAPGYGDEVRDLEGARDADLEITLKAIAKAPSGARRAAPQATATSPAAQPKRGVKGPLETNL